jgi:hypothetical protein
MVMKHDETALTEGAANAQVLAREIDWLEAVMSARFAAYGAEAGRAPSGPTEPPPPPPLQPAHHAHPPHSPPGPYASLVHELALGAPERLLLALALAPHIAPERLDAFLLPNAATGRRFTEFGGVPGQWHAGFLPTAETALFLLAGMHRPRRIALQQALFGPEQPLLRRGILVLDHRHPEEPPLSAALRLSAAGLHRLIQGADYLPPPGADFPATPITTPLDWHDLVLDEATMQQVQMVSLWIEHGAMLMHDWGLARRLKPGYRALFHGGPGTGKTLTACLLGKRHGLPVYRVDLSRVVSKWIGETEKNLAALFDQAEDRRWILFFDEADALFGKRSEARSANDRSANQQIAYLLQRLEGFSGLAILASNLSAHMDEAFARRFQAMVAFAMPDAAARLRLWRETFESPGLTLAPGVDFQALAERFELAGGGIINVLRHAALKAAQRRPAVVNPGDLLEAIRLELHKEGRHLMR